jgi:hypothetical protein
MVQPFLTTLCIVYQTGSRGSLCSHNQPPSSPCPCQDKYTEQVRDGLMPPQSTVALAT